METITFIKRTERTSKAGKPFTSVSIKTQEHGEKYMSGFGNKDNAGWKVGDKVNIKVTPNGEYLNFETLKASEQSNEVLEKILNKLTGINLDIQIIKEAVLTKERLAQLEDERNGFHYPTAEEEGINEDNIPF